MQRVITFPWFFVSQLIENSKEEYFMNYFTINVSRFSIWSLCDFASCLLLKPQCLVPLRYLVPILLWALPRFLFSNRFHCENFMYYLSSFILRKDPYQSTISSLLCLRCFLLHSLFTMILQFLIYSSLAILKLL